ncbi:MAG: HEPN domain-containing protein [bacterium]|nr:HEPN domain-containing protein [bacterium]
MSNRDHAHLLLQLAQADVRAVRGMADKTLFSDAIVGFHAQQAVEKALKAILSMHAIIYPKTHDLDELGAMVRQHVPTALTIVDEILALTEYAVQYRYDFFPEVEPLDRQHIADVVSAFVDQISAALPQ